MSSLAESNLGDLWLFFLLDATRIRLFAEPASASCYAIPVRCINRRQPVCADAAHRLRSAECSDHVMLRSQDLDFAGSPTEEVITFSVAFFQLLAFCPTALSCVVLFSALIRLTGSSLTNSLCLEEDEVPVSPKIETGDPFASPSHISGYVSGGLVDQRQRDEAISAAPYQFNHNFGDSPRYVPPGIATEPTR